MQTISESERSVRELANAHDWWNTWSVRLVALTVIVTALYFVAQWMTNRRGNDLNKAQAVLIKAKDDQLAGDLKSKDVSISAADQKAADAQKETARLTKEAEQAKAERAEADKQIAIAKADAARAKEGIASSEARSLEASAEVSRLRVTVANAEKERARAQTALLELQEKLKHRHVTAEMRATIIELSRTVQKGDVVVYAFIGDDEAITFSGELVEALVAAGWNAKHVGQHVALFARGIAILVRDKETTPKHAGFLQDVLKHAGLDIPGIVTDQVQEGTVALFVGPKP